MNKRVFKIVFTTIMISVIAVFLLGGSGYLYLSYTETFPPMYLELENDFPRCLEGLTDEAEAIESMLQKSGEHVVEWKPFGLQIMRKKYSVVKLLREERYAGELYLGRYGKYYLYNFCLR